MNLVGLTEKLAGATVSFGRALVALRSIPQGEIIIRLEGRIVATPGRHTIQVDHDRHLAPEGHAWALINHSCVPNAWVELSRNAVVAISAIEPGDQITFNYLTTEWQMAEPFRCNCGAPHCPGEIAGFRFLSPPRRDALRPYLSHTSPVREPTGPEAINPAGRRRIGFPGVRRRTQS